MPSGWETTFSFTDSLALARCSSSGHTGRCGFSGRVIVPVTPSPRRNKLILARSGSSGAVATAPGHELVILIVGVGVVGVEGVVLVCRSTHMRVELDSSDLQVLRRRWASHWHTAGKLPPSR